MIAFILKRLGAGVILLVVISFITFCLVHLGGANIARNVLGPEADAQQVAAKATELGLDQPLLTQYIEWVSGVLRGNLGTSWFSPESVSSALLSRASVTLSLVTISIVIVATFSVAFGVIAAVRRGWVDRVVQIVSVVGAALPNFWIAMVLVVLFAVGLRILPATGYVTPAASVGGWLASLVLPVTALVIGGIAAAAQQTRGAVIDVLSQDYIRTLRSRGLSTRSVLLKHTLKNAAPPTLTILSLQFIGMIGGAVVIEKVFALPGLGLLAVNAALRSDVPIIMGVVMMLAVIVIVVNLLIDVAAGWANPKVRVS
ncbi:ABC transporter permease [Lysinibacter sp. HNR]|uniref:ABC transporter permease n=1 Tax=Lysinibacter sp. HNR TaxID=3031408 RepID=UPI002434ECAD|nr:ABC transporter permease [Lysinibacter sp. HNR]WGD37324.1 ABC transporter permease [Lysinibacter sp. HNR]